MKYAELAKKLRRLGCEYVRPGPGSHEIWLNLRTGRAVPIPYHRTKDIGPGLFIQHGYGTAINCAKIGRNCWINQQVTIGFLNDTDKPTLGDDVTIYAGAKVLGNVRIGDKSIVGANAVVVKDVPENCAVAAVPAYIMRRNVIKEKEPL